MRPRRCRRIGFKPDVIFFKPAGAAMINLEESVLTFDELEAIRLKDLQELEQEEAAKKMNISQPTFHRLLTSARKKIADSLINGKAIKIQGGNYKMMQPRGQGFGRGGFGRPPNECVCPACKHRQKKVRGVPCSQTRCEKCKTPMMRGD